MSAAILIPARMAASRLPDKPLMEIHGLPMVIHVMRSALEADCGQVFVAAGNPIIADCVQDYGGNAILTDADLPSGTDRIWQAFTRAKADNHITSADYLMNLQGDLPNIAPHTIKTAVEVAQHIRADITTPVAIMTDTAEIEDENIVKAALLLEDNQTHARALYFSRNPIPFNAPHYYHHIGLYVFTIAALQRFVTLPQTLLEKTERLEQLRALQNGMHIEAFLAEQIPLGVDTIDDFHAICALMADDAE